MELSQFTLQLGVIFLPGIIAALLIELLTDHPPWTPFRLALYAFVLGIACHVLFALLAAGASYQWPPEIAFLESIRDQKLPLPYSQIIGASLVAPNIAALLAAATNKKWLFRAAHALRLTNKHGDMDVWGYAFNSRELPGWIVVRDLANDLAYEGWLISFSDSTSPNELLLVDVRVLRNSTGDELYPLKALYWARTRENTTVEFLGEGRSMTTSLSEKGN